MSKPSLYDNDAALKLSVYACWEALAPSPFFPPAVLKVSTFSLQSQSKKARNVADVEGFRTRLAAFLALCEVIEPTEEEIALATDLEERATAAGGELDTGESQLIAVLVSRALPYLVTGDKRAVKALVALAFNDADGRIVCLEQALRHIVEHGDWAALRAQVCAEKAKDTATTMAFGCYSNSTQATIIEGLDSYIANLRSATGAILMA